MNPKNQFFYNVSNWMLLLLEHSSIKWREINLERIYLEVLEENQTAININIYQKLGFKVESTLRLHSYQDGIRKNVKYMGLLKDEFV